MIYFNLSLHRSATTSVAKVFKESHFECLDWVGWDFERDYNNLFYGNTCEELLEAITANFPGRTYYGDLPIPLLYEQLLAQYPEANYFIVLRDVHEWAISSYEHMIFTARRAGNPSDELLTPANRMMFDRYGLLAEVRLQLSRHGDRDLMLRLWSRLYHLHIISIVETFTRKAVPLRLFYLSDPDIGAQIREYSRPGLPREIYSSYKLPQCHQYDRGRGKKQRNLVRQLGTLRRRLAERALDLRVWND